MLRVWGISGEEVASFSTELLSDVAALKLDLRTSHGFPVCMQELLHGSMLLGSPFFFFFVFWGGGGVQGSLIK